MTTMRKQTERITVGYIDGNGTVLQATAERTDPETGVWAARDGRNRRIGYISVDPTTHKASSYTMDPQSAPQEHDTIDQALRTLILDQADTVLQ